MTEHISTQRLFRWRPDYRQGDLPYRGILIQHISFEEIEGLIIPEYPLIQGPIVETIEDQDTVPYLPAL
jgi:hypothetical protein